MKTSSLKGRSLIHTVPIDFGDGDILTVKVNSARMTWAKQRELQQTRDINETAKIFFSVCVEWDLTDEDGNALPMTPESIADFPVEVTRKIFEKVAETWNPKAENAS